MQDSHSEVVARPDRGVYKLVLNAQREQGSGGNTGSWSSVKLGEAMD